jgi:hypothetical protein
MCHPLLNFSLNLTSLNNSPTFISSVSLHHRFEQHLNSANIFSSLLLLSSSLSNFNTVDSTNSDTKFENLILHFMYRSNTSFLIPSSLPFSSNYITDSSMSQEEFEAFSKLSLHVFSFSSTLLLFALTHSQKVNPTNEYLTPKHCQVT